MSAAASIPTKRRDAGFPLRRIDFAPPNHPRVAPSVDHYNDIEGPGQGSQEVRILDVTDEKREIGMRLARLFDHGGAEIDAHAERGFEGGEEIARAASELEPAGAFGNEEFEVEKVLVVKECAALEPFSALGRARVGETADLALARRHPVIAAGYARSLRHPPGIRDSNSLAQSPIRQRRPRLRADQSAAAAS